MGNLKYKIAFVAILYLCYLNIIGISNLLIIMYFLPSSTELLRYVVKLHIETRNEMKELKNVLLNCMKGNGMQLGQFSTQQVPLIDIAKVETTEEYVKLESKLENVDFRTSLVSKIITNYIGHCSIYLIRSFTFCSYVK